MTSKQEKNEVQINMADQIWNEIKDLKIDIYSLPNQRISDHCTEIKIEPTKLYLQSKIPAIIPFLESIIPNKFQVYLVDKYICISTK